MHGNNLAFYDAMNHARKPDAYLAEVKNDVTRTKR